MDQTEGAKFVATSIDLGRFNLYCHGYSRWIDHVTNHETDVGNGATHSIIIT